MDIRFHFAGHVPGSGIAGSHGDCVWPFEELQADIPPRQARGFSLHLNDCHPGGCEVLHLCFALPSRLQGAVFTILNVSNFETVNARIRDGFFTH